MWNNKHKFCLNCKTTNSQHRARGYCKNCYPIQLRVEKVEKWEFGIPETLKSCPSEFLRLDKKTFSRIRKGMIQQLKERLEWFRNREKMLNENVSGIILEYGFSRLAKNCGANSSGLFHGSANTFDHNFSQTQKNILFEFINRIEQDIRWKGIDFYRVLSERRQNG